MNHSFTSVIIEILTKHFKKDAETIFNLSNLLKYINESIKNTHHNLTGISDSGASNSVSKINLNKFFINLSI